MPTQPIDSAALLEASKCIKAESPVLNVKGIHCNNSEKTDELKSPSQRAITSNKSLTVCFLKYFKNTFK